MIVPNASEVAAAATRIAGVALRSPLIANPMLDEAVGGRVLLKLETLQRTGSFKFRGAYNRLVQLDAAQRRAGVVAFSSGNHGQAVAAAARLLDVPAVIVMPADAPQVKLAGVRRHGAELQTYDRWTESREDIAAGIAWERKATIVPSFDDPHIIVGQGTCGLEIAETLTRRGIVADRLLVPTSGGGLAAGCALGMAALQPGCAIFSVEPAGFDDHARSLASGERQRVASGARSICDALLALEPGEITFAINRERLAGGLTVDDGEVIAAMRFALEYLKLVLEPSGAIALAALLAGKVDVRGVSVALCSGGNADPATLAKTWS